MEASADSQDAFLHDDFTLSTVEEGSEESQSCTFAADTAASCDGELLSADDGGGEDEASERNRYDDDAYEGEGNGEDGDDYAHTHAQEESDGEREESGEEQPSAEEDACYAQEEHDEDPEEGDEKTNPKLTPRSESERKQQFTSDFVGSCHATLTRLRKRKREQEERVEALVEVAFGQIDAVVNSLMSTIQECHAGSHNRFEIADEKLVRNLQFHDRMEKKLKMVAAILAEGTPSRTQEEDE